MIHFSTGENINGLTERFTREDFRTGRYEHAESYKIVNGNRGMSCA